VLWKSESEQYYISRYYTVEGALRKLNDLFKDLYVADSVKTTQAGTLKYGPDNENCTYTNQHTVNA
jgi:hypothetical protein